MSGVVYVCAGCGLLDISSRSHKTTCSGACRVRAHRNGFLKSLHETAARLDISAASILQADAITRLRPDLADRIKAGTMTIDEAMPETSNAFWKVLQRHLPTESEEAA